MERQIAKISRGQEPRRHLKQHCILILTFKSAITFFHGLQRPSHFWLEILKQFPIALSLHLFDIVFRPHRNCHQFAPTKFSK